MTQGAEGRGGHIQVIQRPLQQIVQIGIRVLGLDRGFQQLATIAGQQSGGVASPQAFPPLADGNLAQAVKLAVAGAAEGDFRTEKQIKLATERAGLPPGG